MIVIERDFLARWVREMKQRQTRDNGVDSYTAYISALTAVEAFIAMMPEYDLNKLADLPHPGLYSPEEVAAAMHTHAQGDTRFGAWEKILYSPSEVCAILKGRAEKGL